MHLCYFICEPATGAVLQALSLILFLLVTDAKILQRKIPGRPLRKVPWGPYAGPCGRVLRCPRGQLLPLLQHLDQAMKGQPRFAGSTWDWKNRKWGAKQQTQETKFLVSTGSGSTAGGWLYRDSSAWSFPSFAPILVPKRPHWVGCQHQSLSVFECGWSIRALLYDTRDSRPEERLLKSDEWRPALKGTDW